MKKKIYYCLFVLLLLGFHQTLSAQCASGSACGGALISASFPTVVNGVTVDRACRDLLFGGIPVACISNTVVRSNNCGSTVTLPVNQATHVTGGVLGSGPFEVDFTFSSPQTSIVLAATHTIAEFALTPFDVTTNIGNPTLSVACGCNTTISGNTVNLNGSGSTNYAGAEIVVSSATPFTTITLIKGSEGSNPNSIIFVGMCAASITGACTAGTTAPTFTSTNVSNTCPTTTFDLTSLTATNDPGGVNLTWHTGTPATTANLVPTPTAVGAGTYYAAFYDATNDCYSGSGGDGSATTQVSVAINIVDAGSFTVPNACFTEGQPISIVHNGDHDGSNTQLYAFANPFGIILQINTTPDFGARPLGDYIVAAVNYSTGGIDNLNVGTKLSALSGACFEVVSIPIEICRDKCVNFLRVKK